MKYLGVVLVVAGLAPGWVAAPILAQTTSKVEQGAALFASQRCTLCHSAAGKGNPKGTLDNLGAKRDEIRDWIVDPEGMRAKSHATRTPAMKPFKLNADQVEALVAFITSLKPTPASAADK